MTSPASSADLSDARQDGIRDAMGIPAISIFSTMVGFAAIAKEAGFGIAETLATTILVWGMPGQVAMASLHMAGASALVIFTAVTLANMRMLLMTISGIEIMGFRHHPIPFWKRLLLVQMLAITSWVQLGAVEHRYTPATLTSYFTGLGGMIFCSGVLGTVTGYVLADQVPQEVLRAILVITPLYILMMVINARRIRNRLAGLAGGILCPVLFPLIGEWAILAAGLLGGTLVMLWRMADEGAGR